MKTVESRLKEVEEKVDTTLRDLSNILKPKYDRIFEFEKRKQNLCAEIETITKEQRIKAENTIKKEVESYILQLLSKHEPILKNIVNEVIKSVLENKLPNFKVDVDLIEDDD